MPHIRFMFNRIKDYSLIYEEIPCPAMVNFGIEESQAVEEKDHIKDYCVSVLNDVIPKIPSSIEFKYKGCLERIGNEVFEINTNEAVYTVSFTVNTFTAKNAILYVDIKCEYLLSELDSRIDCLLEKLKIELKNRLIKDWDSCSWLVDEQSEQLCSELYPMFFRLENEIRAFVGRVLEYHVGPNWLDCFGLEKYSDSAKSLSETFKQRVPEFDNVNAQLISLTLESLFEIVFYGEIYKDETKLKAADFKTIEKICKSGGKPENIKSFLEKKREIKYKIWDELLKQYFNSPEDFQTDVTKFINSRNHIAHNKLTSWNAYKIILEELDNIEEHLDSANEKFDSEAISKEVETTLDYLNEQEDYDDRDYWRSRVASETGIDILDEDEIQERFQLTGFEIHSKILNHFQYDQCFDISAYDDSVQSGTAFTIISNAAKDEELDIDIDMEIDDEMGEDSYLYIFARKSGVEIFKCTVHFANGLGSEDDEFRMQVDQDSVYEDEDVGEFVEQLIQYVENELNPYISKLYAMSYKEKGDNSAVADFPCEFCGKNGISIQEDFYPVGYCCYCGEKNEIATCEVCGTIFNESDEQHNTCDNCMEKVTCTV